MIRYENFFTNFKLDTDREFVKSRASILLFTYTGFSITYNELTEEEVNYIDNALNEFNTIHKDNEIFLYKLMHITNVIRTRYNMKPMAMEDIVNMEIN